MFRRTKRFLVILFTILFITMNINITCFAEEPQSFTAQTPTSNVVETDSAQSERTVKSVHAGVGYSVILYDNGTVATFGSNEFGQLGLGLPMGANKGKNIPTDIENLTDIVALDVGQSHTFAIDRNGSVWTWGRGYRGKLGDETDVDRNTPKLVQLSDFKIISAGYCHSAAVKNDGTVWCWGNNRSGQLGNGKIDSFMTPPEFKPVQTLDLIDVENVFAGETFTFALKNDGTLFGWGRNMSGELGFEEQTNVAKPTEIISDVKNIASSSSNIAHAFALKNDGSIWAWGNNYSGQLGDGGSNYSTTGPIEITGLGDIMEITPGRYHTVALKGDGTVWAWGKNDVGQLGNGTIDDGSTVSPVQVKGLNDIVSIASGSDHAIAVGKDGSVWTWGNNSSGQLGDGTNENRSLPVKIMGPSEPEVDKTALQSKIDEISELDEENYTADSWEIFATALADAQDVLEDDEATQEAVDNALDALIGAIEGLEETAKSIPLTVVVKGKDGTEISTTDYDMSKWEDVKRQHYSTRDSLPSNRLASAEGVFLTDLIDELEIDIDNITEFTFISTDGYGSSISKSELLDVDRYYYPNIHEEDQEEGAVKIGPMLALRSYVAARGSTEAPSWDIIDDLNTIRLFFGQENPDDINYGRFAKWICEIEIEIEEDEPVQKYELNVKDSDDYEIEETETGIMLTLKQDITGFKHFGVTVKALEDKLGQLEVVFTHLRDNMQQSLNSIKANSDMEKMNAEAGFNIEPGDVIKIYMVDELTNETDCNPIILM